MDERQGQALPGCWKSVQHWFSSDYDYRRKWLIPLPFAPKPNLPHIIQTICFPLLRANTSSVQVPSGLETNSMWNEKQSN